jgi:DNA (cytosine-5)-methyltransferase 1
LARTKEKRGYGFYEFFSGGGMARLGLGAEWTCLFSNDIDEKKGENYRRAFGGGAELRTGDVAALEAGDLPGCADLAWASFPCQDLSLAGRGDGLKGRRSALFWEFWRLVKALAVEGRAPRTIALENVYGAITSHGGRDLAAICAALAGAGYRYAPLVVDAALFTPQSRPRLFVVGFGAGVEPPSECRNDGPTPGWHPESFELAYEQLSPSARKRWLWMAPPQPPMRKNKLADLIEENPTGVAWHTERETRRLLSLMSALHLDKVRAAQSSGRRVVGAVYRRTRVVDGEKRQRAEVRFDDTAGCLRTPAGGSSRQTILVVEGERLRSRLLSAREAARLMGLPDEYPLPARYNDAYRLAGDGVAVPVVSWLARRLIEPALNGAKPAATRARRRP